MAHHPLPGTAASQQPPDLYRDTWVRYLGYANEVGESFRALIPKALVWATYGIATAYVTADAVDKGQKAAEANQDGPDRRTDITVAVVDTFVWQALASVAIPGFTINRLCAASLYMMGRVTRWPLPVRKWATTAIGLSAIPVIITPIDRSVDMLLDSSLRKLYGTKAREPESSETR
ncbi:mitochondrial fission process protein 1 [Pseudophryne corroboree]|uniref:mitochondrial fission process protein 1 n=1 Tax=Pseudophryne corroboree TaxID=495146 RepID=UPI0030812206